MWLQWIGLRILFAWITPRSGTSLERYRTPLNNGLVFLQLLIQELKKTLCEQGASDPSSEIWGSIKGPLPNSAGSKSRFSSAFSSIPSRMYRAPGRALAQDLDGSNDVWRCVKASITGSESIQLQTKRWQVWLDAIRCSWIWRYVWLDDKQVQPLRGQHASLMMSWTAWHRWETKSQIYSVLHQRGIINWHYMVKQGKIDDLAGWKKINQSPRLLPSAPEPGPDHCQPPWRRWLLLVQKICFNMRFLRKAKNNETEGW